MGTVFSALLPVRCTRSGKRSHGTLHYLYLCPFDSCTLHRYLIFSLVPFFGIDVSPPAARSLLAWIRLLLAAAMLACYPHEKEQGKSFGLADAASRGSCTMLISTVFVAAGEDQSARRQVYRRNHRSWRSRGPTRQVGKGNAYYRVGIPRGAGCKVMRNR